MRTSGLEAGLGLAVWGLRVALGLIVTKMAGLFASQEQRARAREGLVGDATRRLVALLGRLKGAFAKAGQFAATRHDVLPRGAAESLAQLRDRVPPIPLALAREVVESELGRPLEEAFTRFDAEPIGAASVAQVHRARLPDGREVAVKVQYPWIRDSLERDLRLLRGATRLLLALRGRGGGVVDWERFFDEFAQGLRDELDFVREGRVASEIAANLEGEPQVVVPEIVADHTSARVLTMTWHDCVNVADRSGLRALGAEPAAFLEVLARAYAKQVFVDGLFHADPHPGNLFVLAEPEARTAPRVLFVDFGLSKRLGPDLRVALRQGVYAVLQRDPEALLARMRDLDMIAPGAEAGVRRAIDEMFARIAEQAGQGGVLAASGPQVLALKDEAKRLLQETPGLQLPSELLLYAKTLSYLFALGEELDPDVDLMKLSIPYLLQFLAGRD